MSYGQTMRRVLKELIKAEEEEDKRIDDLGHLSMAMTTDT